MMHSPRSDNHQRHIRDQATDEWYDVYSDCQNDRRLDKKNRRDHMK